MSYSVEMSKFIIIKANKGPASSKNKNELYGEKTISFQGTTLWNNLPNHIKEISSLRAFKPKLKQYLHDKY